MKKKFTKKELRDFVVRAIDYYCGTFSTLEGTGCGPTNQDNVARLWTQNQERILITISKPRGKKNE